MLSFAKKINMKKYDTAFQHPFTCVVAGPTGCGKSTWVRNLLGERDQIVFPKIDKIFWHYGENQELFQTFGKDVHFEQGLPDISTFDGKTNVLLIIDDLMREIDASVLDLFTKGSHHKNISVILLVQNIFDKNKFSRTISLNSQYIVFFKNPRDMSQIIHLAKQMFPHNTKHMQAAYKEATSKPHGYLLVDLKQQTPDEIRLRSKVFESEGVQEVYVE